MATPTAAVGLGARSPAARNFVWLAGDKSIATLLGVLVFGLIARRYGPEGSGHYAYAITLMQVALGMSMVCSTACILPRVTRMHRGIGGALANVFAVRMIGSLLSMAAVACYAVAVIGDTNRLIVALMMLAVVPLVEPFFVAPLYWQSRNANRVPVLNRGAGLSVRAMTVGIAVALDAPLWVPALAWVIEAIVVARLHSMSLRSLGQWRELAAQVTAWRASRYFRYGVRFLAGVALSQLFFRIDRLVLAQILPAHDFGIYATAMQLVDVWLHMVHVVGFSIGPAYLYAALNRTTHPLAHWRTIAVLTGIGLGGLLLAIVFGKPAIALIFGPKFGGSYAYLIAGTAFAVLAFIDSFASTSVTATRRPGALALKWGTGAVVAATTQIILFPSLHAFAGPAGLAIGIVMGWVVLMLLPLNNNRSVGAAPTQGAQA